MSEINVRAIRRRVDERCTDLTAALIDRDALLSLYDEQALGLATAEADLKEQVEWGGPDQRNLWAELEEAFGLDEETTDCAADVADAAMRLYAESLAREATKDAALREQVERFRDRIEIDYRSHPTGCGGSFGEILCWEIHSNGQTFLWLAEKWGVDVGFLGDVIADHCHKLAPTPPPDTEEAPCQS